MVRVGVGVVVVKGGIGVGVDLVGGGMKGVVWAAEVGEDISRAVVNGKWW